MNKTIIELREEAIKEDKNPEFYLYQKLEEKDKEIKRLNKELQQEKIRIRKKLIEHIEDARYELNVILHSDNDLNYKNECSKEFECINKFVNRVLYEL